MPVSTRGAGFFILCRSGWHDPLACLKVPMRGYSLPVSKISYHAVTEWRCPGGMGHPPGTETEEGKERTVGHACTPSGKSVSFSRFGSLLWWVRVALLPAGWMCEASLRCSLGQIVFFCCCFFTVCCNVKHSYYLTGDCKLKLIISYWCITGLAGASEI